MRSRSLGALALLALVALPSCATVHGVRWAYGKPSAYEEPDRFSESVGFRAVVGAPVIVGGVVWDAVTWPLQLVFGVWPMWGEDSQHMQPPSN